MLWSVVNEQDIFYNKSNFSACNSIRSSNPYDYVRSGYFVDNASMFGGKNLVNLNCNFSGNRTGGNIPVSRV